MAKTKPEFTSTENRTYASIALLDLCSNEVLPANLYLCIHHKLVHYRSAGDPIESEAFNKLVLSKVRFVFCDLKDKVAFDDWIAKIALRSSAIAESLVNENPEIAPIVSAVQDQRRTMLDLFEAPQDDKQVKIAIETSKRFVTELMQKPFAVNNIGLLQSYSKGVVDHSVNVSVLSVFLGLRMGYTHQIILENLSLGGLFHDIGKTEIELSGDQFLSEDDPAMQQHPQLGAQLLDRAGEVGNEVRMIVAQHHEMMDGSGYPMKLRGLAIYDLAKLVSIANVYDNLVSKSTKTEIKERASEALDALEKTFEGKFDEKKLEKIVKILRYSLL